MLITGASSGIGQGTAEHFATLGCRLSLVARNAEALKAVSEKCRANGAAEVAFFSHDLAAEAECIAAVEDTVKKFGGKPCVNLWA